MKTQTFLSSDELHDLTGRARKSLQIAELKRMRIHHWINAAGEPVVPRSAIEGRHASAASIKQQEWKPAALSA